MATHTPDPATLDRATIHSDNLVDAQLGIEEIDGGPKAIAEDDRRPGGLRQHEKNPAMVLGISEVTPLQWTYAFSHPRR